MEGTFWALVPPIVAIVLALITKEVYISLLIGILAGALFFTGFNPVTACLLYTSHNRQVLQHKRIFTFTCP